MTKTNAETLNELNQERVTLSETLKDLRRQRAKARVDGGQFSGAAEIGRLVGEIEELDEAIAVARERVERDAQIASLHREAEHLDRTSGLVQKTGNAYLASVERLEEAASAFRGAMMAVHQTATALREVAGSVVGADNLPSLARASYEPRLTARLAHLMSEELPLLNAHRTSTTDADKWELLWREEEAKTLDNALSATIAKIRNRAEYLRAQAGQL